MTPEKIKQLRQSIPKTQEGLATLLGVCVTTISRWEQGRTKPQKRDIQSLEVLARRAGIKTEEEWTP